MIARLTGHITDEALDHFVVDVNGVGYLVHCPIGTAQRAKRLEDGRSTLIIHTVVREDAFLLYGFANQTEREIFLKIIAISGVGPKLASAILSDMDVNEILQTVQSENLQRLTKVSGVGKKTAQRLILELKGSLQNWAPEDTVVPKFKVAASRLEDDLKSALLNLGYKPLLVDDVVDKLSPIPEDMNSIEPLIRQALKLLQ